MNKFAVADIDADMAGNFVGLKPAGDREEDQISHLQLIPRHRHAFFGLIPGQPRQVLTKLLKDMTGEGRTIKFLDCS